MISTDTGQTAHQNTIGSRIFGLQGDQGLMLTNTTSIQNAIGDNPDIAGIFPRWIGLGTVSNPNNQSLGETGSFITYGVILYFSI